MNGEVIIGVPDYGARPFEGAPAGTPGIYTYADGCRELWLAEDGTWEGTPSGFYEVDWWVHPGTHPEYGDYDRLQVRRRYRDESTARLVRPTVSWLGVPLGDT